MQQHQHVQENFSPLDYLILANLAVMPRTATALHEAVIHDSGQVIEPGKFARLLAHTERRGWIASYFGNGSREYRITEPGMLALEAHGRSNQDHYERGPDGHRGKEYTMRLVLWILRLYPPGWRERYEAEMMALLAQHHITLWTILDLLLGALDARLDPYYRQARQLLPLRRFKSARRLLVASFVAFWFALLPWFWMSQIGLDDADCSVWSVWRGNTALCLFRKSVNIHQPALPALLVALILIFLPVVLMFFITMLAVARGKKARTHLELALAVAGGMIVVCIACGFWLGGIWQLLPQIGQFYPLTPAGLIIGIAGMGLATVLALAALVRASSALKDIEQATPQEEPATSSTPASRIRKVAKGELALLAGLVLLFIAPWPGFVTEYLPDHHTQLLSWSLAIVVGLIAAWLVKEPGKTQVQRARQKPPRPISPFWWAAVLAAPAMTFFMFYIGHGPEGFLLLLLAGLVSGAVALIVKIRMGHPRLKSPLVMSLGILVLATILMALGVGHAYFFPQQSLAFVVNMASISAAFFVKVPASSPQVRGESSPPDRGAGATPKVVGWVILLLACNAVFAELSSEFYLNQGQYPRPAWIGNELLLSILMAICLIPALVLKAQAINRRASGAPEPAPNNISSKVWIIVLPILFLTFVTQIANFIGPNFSSFQDVFMIWLQTGVAALIILLAFRLGAGKTTTRGDTEAYQFSSEINP